MTTVDDRITNTDAALVPDPARWGQGFGTNGYSASDLDEIAQNISETTQPGYGRRLYSETPGYSPGDPGGQTAVIPSGFDAAQHPNRTGRIMDPEILTRADGQPQVDASLQRHFEQRGWVLDQHGRALHPHHAQLLDDPRIGLPTSTGAGWWLGESVVADAVLTACGHVLLIDRDTDQGTIPALPGGYAVPSDFERADEAWRQGHRPITAGGIQFAACRKLREEVRLLVPPDKAGPITRAIRPISSPHTLHMWTTTFTVHIPLLPASLPPSRLPDLRAGTWVSESSLDTVLPRMWPDHRRAVLGTLG